MTILLRIARHIGATLGTFAFLAIVFMIIMGAVALVAGMTAQ